VSLHACTIVTPDHVARARVLARSLREHHPHARCTALVVGDAPASSEPFEVLGIEALDCPPLEEMLAAYEPFALVCALKPWLLSRLLEQSPAVLYLDSDLRLYAPLDDAFAAAQSHGLVLTRHLLGPLPRDGRHPSEEDILVAGSFNGGFLGVGRDAGHFLDWWAERTAQECTIDPARGLFLDQRWLELAPNLVPDAAVLRDPGCNAGFWDVPNRPLTGAPGAYSVAGVPLRCFHFSGFDPERPDVLSVHQNRIDLAEHPVLAGLLRDYAQELHDAGHAAMPEPRPAVRTGLVRRLYREGRASGELRHPLTSRAGEAELAAWLAEPAEPGAWAGLTRYLLAYHAASPELRSEFPDLDGPGALGFAEWLRAHADRHPDLPAATVPAAIEVGGRELEPLLLALFRERAEPLAEFLAWLAEPAPEGGEAGATRYLVELHRFRPDLRAAFPVVGPELVAWARQIGVGEHPQLGELLYASPERAGAGSFV
jgi:hypothetical protein